MAKKTFAQTRKSRKGQMAKKREVEKLIGATQLETSWKASLTGKKLPQGYVKVRLPPEKPHVHLPPTRNIGSEPMLTAGGPKEPKKVLPGLPQDSRCREPDHLILDRRHLMQPGVPLIHLPKEPTTTRSLRYTPKGHFPFLILPGELRNKIYDYVIPREIYALDWLGGNQKSKTMTYRLPRRSKAFGPRLKADALERRVLLRNIRYVGRKNIMEEQYRESSPVSLLWVCKQMYPEASSMFYSKSTFLFSLLGTLRHFLDTLHPQNKASITRLAINYHAYGHPVKTENQRWKARHDRAWEDLCWKVSEECTSLTNLALDLVLNKSPLRFTSFDNAADHGVSTRWMLPLWAFQDVDIKRCWCHLRSTSIEETVLEVESQIVRKEILGANWDEEAEATRDAYGFEKIKPRRNGIVLTLKESGEIVGEA